MKYLYFDCSMGAAGDMLCSALWELVEDKKAVLNEIKSINIPDVEISFDNVNSFGLNGTHTIVNVFGREELSHRTHKHIHRTREDVFEIIDKINTDAEVKENAKAVYSLIADAESKAHNADASVVHFHEVGMLDAIADVVLFCLLIKIISPDKICSSSINTGKGTVKCAHGILPVPAPATAQLLQGTACYNNDVEGELCTPTGAALLKYFVDEFCDMPEMVITHSGVGFGVKEFDRPNCVRTFAGFNNDENKNVTELVCNVDDMTGEDIAYAAEKMLENGALDTYVQSIYMKKGRPAFKLSVLCRNDEVNKFAELIFKHTTTIGIREKNFSRFVMNRRIIKINTRLGDVTVKESSYGDIVRRKPEFDELRRLANDNNISVSEVRNIVNEVLEQL